MTYSSDHFQRVVSHINQLKDGQIITLINKVSGNKNIVETPTSICFNGVKENSFSYSEGWWPCFAHSCSPTRTGTKSKSTRNFLYFQIRWILNFSSISLSLAPNTKSLIELRDGRHGSKRSTSSGINPRLG